MSKEDWEREKQILKGSSNQIFEVSAIWGEVLIWMFLFLLAYSEIILFKSFEKNLLKIVIVAVIMAGLVYLGVFLIIKARRHLKKVIGDGDDTDDE